MKYISATAPMISNASTFQDVQPQLFPLLKARIINALLRITVTKPGRSKAFVSLAVRWKGRHFSATAIAMIPIGRLIMNSDSQPKYPVSHPPSVGPRAGASMEDKPQRLIANACFSFSIN
ncbi:hypothetical protein D3C87_1619380 [compost metagenome]